MNSALQRMTWILFGVVPSAVVVAGAVSCVGSEPMLPSGSGGSTSEGDGGTCPLTACGSACVDTKVDPANCGACDHACAAGEVCAAGACALSCPASQSKCGASCADTQIDPANCGACDHACAAGEVCVAGACSLSCPASQSKCGSACADTQIDPANCGACGHACDPGEVCTAGACALSCPPSQSQCSAGCADTQVDPANCGACDHACDPGEVCAAGACSLVCPASLSLCDGGATCVDLQTSNAHCGDCDVTCAAGQTCVAGQCALVCEAGRMACPAAGSSQLCVDPKTDPDNCGACGTLCGPEQFCAGGACGYATSCADLKARVGSIADGSYVIQPAGKKPFTVFCYHMSTASPAEYLTLLHTRDNGATLSNYSTYDRTSCKPTPTSPICTDNAFRYWEKVRIDPATLVIDLTDATFATNVTNDPACWAAVTGVCAIGRNLPYATAGNCVLNGAPVPGSVDLRGLPFSVDPSVTFVPTGSNPYGTSTFSPDRKRVDFTGGGYCGGNGPAGSLILKQD